MGNDNGGPDQSKQSEFRGVQVFISGPGQISTVCTGVDPITALGMLEVAKQTVLNKMAQGHRPTAPRLVVPQVQVGV